MRGSPFQRIEQFLRPGGQDRILWIVAATACVVRLAAVLATDGLHDPELNEYSSIARALLAGQGFVYAHLGIPYYSYAPPLYAWLLAAGYWLTGSIVPVMLLQVAAGSAVAVAAADIARRLFGGWVAGAVAGLLMAFHPGLAYYSATQAHPLTFNALFFTLALLQVLRLADRPTVRRAVELGVIVGVGALCRATIVVFLPLAGIWLLAVTRRDLWPRAARHVVIAGLCAAIILLPWAIRNSLIHGHFVFMVTVDNEVFWRGNNPHATGHSYVDAERIVLDTLSSAERADLERQPDELAQSQWFKAQATAFIRERPGDFIRSTLRKFFYFWWFAPQTGTLYAPLQFWLYAAYYVTAVPFALLGCWSAVSRGGHARSQMWLLGLFLFGLSFLQSLYYVEGRHRWAVEPMVLAVSGGGVMAVLGGRKRTL